MYIMKFLKFSLLQHSDLWVCTISQLNYRSIVPVTEHLDALPLRVGLTLVTDEKPFKIFTAVHIIIILMFTARR